VNQDIGKFFALLSPSLHSYIKNFLHFKVINGNQHMLEATDIEINYIVSKLQTQLFVPGDEIVKQGEIGKSMYFVSNGQIEVVLVRLVPLKAINVVPGFETYSFPKIKVSAYNSPKKKNSGSNTDGLDSPKSPRKRGSSPNVNDSRDSD
jgi:hypothetical protein